MKVRYFLMAFFTIAGGVCLWMISSSPLDKSSSNVELNDKLKAVKVEEQKTNVSSSSAGLRIPNKNELSQYLTDNEAYRAELWNKAHGYFGATDLAEYQTYSMLDLQKLAVAGDLRALQVVAESHLRAGELDAAMQDFLHAAAHGSVSSLTSLALLQEAKYSAAATDEEREKISINTLAFLEAAIMRGDSFAAPMAVDDFKRMRNFDPTVSQQEKIKSDAHLIYSTIEDMRNKLGLAAFDNSSDVNMKKLWDMKQKYR